ncbi:hypothetical protein ACOSP7_031205 [Xanthoceras sorbifolium]
MRHMRSVRPFELKPFDPEIERTLHQCLREVKAPAAMDNPDNPEANLEAPNVPRLLKDYAVPTVDGTLSSIRKPAVAANNFEIKPAII